MQNNRTTRRATCRQPNSTTQQRTEQREKHDQTIKRARQQQDEQQRTTHSRWCQTHPLASGEPRPHAPCGTCRPRLQSPASAGPPPSLPPLRVVFRFHQLLVSPPSPRLLSSCTITCISCWRRRTDSWQTYSSSASRVSAPTWNHIGYMYISVCFSYYIFMWRRSTDDSHKKTLWNLTFFIFCCCYECTIYLIYCHFTIIVIII